MSTLKVEVVAIDAIEKHPKADRLDLVKIKEWRVVAGRDSNTPDQPRYKKGDLCIYLPIDSVLPEKLESFLFPPDSKVKLSKSRIKTIKLRGAISQGMICDLSFDLLNLYPKLKGYKVGQDVTEILGVTKYEPPASSVPVHMQVKQAKNGNNPHFHKYNDIENFKNYSNTFEEGDDVYISEKLHGTSARYGKLPSAPANFFQKILKWFGLLPKFQFCYGSRNVQLQGKLRKQLFYTNDVYAKIAKQYGLESKLDPGEVIYGEIVGHGIQGGYSYGHKEGEHSFYVYDVKCDGKYLPYGQFLAFCSERGLKTVPYLYRGRFHKEHADSLRTGRSHVGDQPVREGIVIKCANERDAWHGRRVLKYINDDYLLQKDLTDFH